MAAVIIDKRDVDILAKELLKGIFDYVNDEEQIKDIVNYDKEKKELEKTRKDFYHRLCLNYIFHIRIKTNFKCERIDRKIVDKITLEESYDLDIVNEAMKDNAIDTRAIYDSVKFLNICNELNGDLNSKRNAFKKNYEILVEDYKWLE